MIDNGLESANNGGLNNNAPRRRGRPPKGVDNQHKGLTPGFNIPTIIGHNSTPRVGDPPPTTDGKNNYPSPFSTASAQRGLEDRVAALEGIVDRLKGYEGAGGGCWCFHCRKMGETARGGS